MLCRNTIALCLAGLILVGLAIQPAAVAAREPDPQGYLASAMSVFNRVEKGNITGESFCWHAAYSLGTFLQAYQAYGDTAWLDAGVTYYDRLMAVRAVGPGGYKSFIGPYIYDTSVWSDVQISDAIIYRGLLGFAEEVLADEALAARYGDKARSYLAEAEKHMFEKWEARGTWRQDGPFGGYVIWDRYGAPGEFTDWINEPALTKAGISLPFNKQNDLAVCYLIMHRLTGKQVYLDRATSIFSFLRSRMQFVEGRYQWSYWEPLGPWDVKPDARGYKHWINTHPYRNYQAGEVSAIVAAYDAGVVFTEEDLRRILRTNLEVMWNGDKEHPEFVNSNAKLPGYRKPSASQRYPTWAGTLWTALARFDGTVRMLRRATWAGKPPSNMQDRIARDFFEKVTCAGEPGFTRVHVAADAPTVAPYRFADFTGESAELMFVAALPCEIKQGGSSYLCCNAYVDGELAVSVYPLIYKGLKAIPMTPPAIYKGPIAGGRIFKWDLTDPDGKPLAPGSYVVRWSFKDGHREMPLVIKP